jgi:hypothetical protein
MLALLKYRSLDISMVSYDFNLLKPTDCRLVVSVLATGPKVHGFKPGRGRWILRVIKYVARLPSEGK